MYYKCPLINYYHRFIQQGSTGDRSHLIVSVYSKKLSLDIVDVCKYYHKSTLIINRPSHLKDREGIICDLKITELCMQN